MSMSVLELAVFLLVGPCEHFLPFPNYILRQFLSQVVSAIPANPVLGKLGLPSIKVQGFIN